MPMRKCICTVHGYCKKADELYRVQIAAYEDAKAEGFASETRNEFYIDCFDRFVEHRTGAINGK